MPGFAPARTYLKPPTRVPLPYPDENGLQANACQNFKCTNFGVPVDPAYKPLGMAAHGHLDRYKLNVTVGSKVLVKCLVCGGHLQVRSNQGIHEEMTRQMKYLLKPALSCPNPQCVNHMVSVKAGTKHYHAHPKTRAGSQRFRCQACKKTFTRKKTPTLGQRKANKNAIIAAVFVSGVPLRMISRTTLHLAPSTLYGKLNFFYKQFQAFAASRERRFLDDRPILVDDPRHPGKKIDVMRRVRVSVDQLYVSVNWPTKDDQRITQLKAIATMDEGHKYLYSLQLNYDPDVDWNEIMKYNDLHGEDNLPVAFRRYARFVTPKEHEIMAAQNEYLKELRERKEKRLRGIKNKKLTLKQQSLLKYAGTKHRLDPDSPDDEQELDTKVPENGMLVFSGYLAYGHFHMLRRLFHKAGKIRFSFEQEGAFVGAALTAFADRIREKRCDIFFVLFEKGWYDGEKKKAYEEGQNFIRTSARAEGISFAEAWLKAMKRAINDAKPRGKYKDRFMIHPCPSVGTPGKEVAYVTDRGVFSPDGVTGEDHLCRLYDKTCMLNLDTFFRQIRAHIKPISRPDDNPSGAPPEGKYCPHHLYRPDLVPKWLELYRVYHNFVQVGDDGRTPAMRMGLAKVPIPVEDILHFRPT